MTTNVRGKLRRRRKCLGISNSCNLHQDLYLAPLLTRAALCFTLSGSRVRFQVTSLDSLHRRAESCLIMKVSCHYETLIHAIFPDPLLVSLASRSYRNRCQDGRLITWTTNSSRRSCLPWPLNVLASKLLPWPSECVRLTSSPLNHRTAMSKPHSPATTTYGSPR